MIEQADLLNITIPLIDVSALSSQFGEPRIHDLTLARALGFSNIHMIRPLIKRHVAELGQLGEVSFMREKPTGKGGRPGKGYWLNEEQAIYITSKSDTEKSAKITIAMTRVFRAYLSGKLNAPLLPPSFGQGDDTMLIYLCNTFEILIATRSKIYSSLSPTGKAPELEDEAYWTWHDLMVSFHPQQEALREGISDLRDRILKICPKTIAGLKAKARVGQIVAYSGGGVSESVCADLLAILGQGQPKALAAV
jgi:hypothetical protein